MQTLEARLSRLEDVKAIETLKYTYAKVLDNGYDPQSVAALFTEDGLWSPGGVGDAQGRASIMEHSSNWGKDILWVQHNIFARVIEVGEDGTSATGSFYVICFLTMKADNAAGELSWVLAAKYHDKFVKIDGHWLFSELVGHITSSTTLSEGWVRDAFAKKS